MLISDIQGLGTHWWFQIYDGNESAEFYKNFISKEIARFESAYSRFLPDSQISHLNRDRLLVNPGYELLELLNIGKDFYTKTQGVFNPGIGGILENRGYDASYSFQNKGQGEVVPDFDKLVKIHKDKIELIGEGNIDLGGYGKGFLIDQLTKMFRAELGIQNFLINGGGDIYAAGEMDHEVILEHPFAPGYELGRIRLRNQGLGCSSNQKRVWKNPKTGEKYRHIIHPKKLQSRLDIGSFVVAENSIIADMMGTVVCLISRDNTMLDKIQSIVKFEYISVFDNNTLLKPK
jgi:FAD:protein FMN transferase